MKYTILTGDTLQTIALRFLGDSKKWTILWNMNKATLKSGNPNVIYVGEILEVPEVMPEPVPKKTTDENEVFLYVNGKEFSGWKEVLISRSIEAVAGSFSVSVVEKWPGLTEKWPLNEGDRVQVRIGNDSVVNGYIDEMDTSTEPDSHEISVKGRDKTGDLVDCSADARPGEWQNKTLDKIAEDLCGPFGIIVKTEASVGGAIEKFTMQPGESVFETLDKAAKHAGILVTSNRDGNLLLTTTGNKKIGFTLKEGENILRASINRTSKDRFSKYIVEGQVDGGTYESACGLSSTATDQAVKRHRPLVIVTNGQVNYDYLKKRASWEAIVRAARSTSVTVEVQGWRDGNGDLWTENTIINVDIPSLKVSGELLISAVEFKKGANVGTTTAMTLKRKDAFTPEIAVPNSEGV